MWVKNQMKRRNRVGHSEFTWAESSSQCQVKAEYSLNKWTFSAYLSSRVWSREQELHQHMAKRSKVKSPGQTLHILCSGYWELGIDSTPWLCLCSGLVGCPSCVDTAAIPDSSSPFWEFPSPPSSLSSENCYFHVSLFLNLFFHFVEAHPSVDFWEHFEILNIRKYHYSTLSYDFLAKYINVSWILFSCRIFGNTTVERAEAVLILEPL